MVGTKVIQFTMDPPASQEDKKEAIMGCAVFYPMLRLDIGQHLYLDNIVVRNKHQRKGVARALIYRLREEAAKLYGNKQ